MCTFARACLLAACFLRLTFAIDARILSGTVFGGAAAVLWSVDEANPNGYYGDIKTWTFEPREGLHSLIVPAVAISLYLAMVAFLPMVMKNREPLNLKWLMLIHNYILSTGSLVATIAMVRLVSFPRAKTKFKL